MPAVTFARFANEVEEIYALKQPATLCMMRQVLREFAALEGLRKTSDLRPVMVARWIKAHPDRGAATAEKLLRSLKSAVTIGIASGYFRASPIAFKIDVPEPDFASEIKRRHHPIVDMSRVLELAAEEAAGFDWKAGRLHALACLFAYVALRRDEGLLLQANDVDLRRHVLKVYPKRAHAQPKLKTPASAALVPMAPPLVEVLERWIPRTRSLWLFPNVCKRGPWTGGPPGHKPLDQFKALGRRAGVDGLTFLSCRHSFATHAPMWGVPPEMVQRILRHTTPRTKHHYEHEDVDDLVASVARVLYRPPAASSVSA